jgi:hypothetical protein
LASGGSDQEWIRIRVLNDAGILSHYVVDASQPHHTTIHFNGWAEGAPNPLGFTTDRDFHARFESDFVRAHLAFQDLPPLLPETPARLGDVRVAVWEYIRETNGTVAELYRLEKEHGFDPNRPAHSEARAFAVRRLARGAEMLAGIWWTAWEDSAELAARMEREGWNR